MGAAGAVPDLIAALQDRDRAVRIAAARSLGAIGSPEAAPVLVECLTDGRLPWLVGGQALIDIGSPAAPTLRELSAAAGSPSRGRAIELLGYVGDAGDAPFVREALSSESADIRERAARALGRLGARDAVTGLRQRLADPEPAVAAAAATSLGSIGDRRGAGRTAGARTGRAPQGSPGRRACGRIPRPAGRRAGRQDLPAPASISARRPIWRRSDARRGIDAWAVVTLLYFLLLGAMSLVFTIVAWVSLRRFERSRHYFPADEAFASPLTPGVSIILPALDEQAGVVESVRSLLALRYPSLEVVVVNDGSTRRRPGAAPRSVRPRTVQPGRCATRSGGRA